MADFRKYALATGVACLLGITGLASAQTTSGINCVANAATPLQDRAEGITEVVGDVVLSCQGGTVTPVNIPVPAVNVTVSLNTQVTSRLLNGSGSQTDAMLLINDPAPGFQNLCPLSNNACSATTYGTNFGGGKGNGQYTGYNVFEGILVAPNTLTFFNVPIDAPGTGIPTNGPLVNGSVPVLTLRITNVRANASALGAPTGFSSTSITEFISTSAGFTISQPSQTVGNVLTGLVSKSVGGVGTTSTSLTVSNPIAYSSGTAPSLTQCTSNSLSSSSSTAALTEFVNFSEGFATATKLQYAANPATQGIPGNASNVESDFLLNGSTSAGIGTADYATRVRIVFAGLQAGVTIYVPTTLPSNTLNLGSPTEFMTLTATEAGAFSPVTGSSTSYLPSSFSAGAIYGGFAALTVTTGGAEAVYQVTSQQTVSPNVIESFSVPVVVTYTAAPGATPPSPGLGATTVTVDFAPISTVVTAAASPIPRFISTSPNLTGFTISTCATNLLFPFVTNQAGFDTGLAIASTSTDPFGTTPQSGTCTLNFYGSGAPAAFVTPTVTSGTVYTTLASSVSPGFQGYMIAQCKFQFGHGFAFITDGFGGPGRGLSEGYLPLIIPDVAITSGRKANPNTTTTGSGEILSN